LLRRIRSTLAAQMFPVIWSKPSANKAQIKGKPAKVVEKIVEEKLGKLFSTVCLVEQAFGENLDQTIEELIKSKIAELGESPAIGRRFTGYLLGEPLRTRKKLLFNFKRANKHHLEVSWIQFALATRRDDFANELKRGNVICGLKDCDAQERLRLPDFL
jgi:hypothetical protein